MVLSTCAIIFIVAFFSLFNFRNKFTNVIMLYFFSICMMMLISVLYVSKFMNYTNVGSFDFQMYLWLSRRETNAAQINMLYNTAIAIFMFASVYFLALIRRISLRKILPVFLITAAFFMYTNSHDFIWIMYSKIHYAADPSHGFYKILMDLIIYINTGIIALAITTPFVCLFSYYINTRIYIKKKNAILYAVCLGCVNIFLLLMFYKGFFPSIASKNINTIGMPQFVSGDNIPMYFSLLLFLMVILTVMIMLYFKPFKFYVLVREREIVKNSTRINKNIRMTFHMHKNSFIGIEKKTQIAKALMEENQTALVSKQLSDIATLANESIHRIERLLDVLRDPSMCFENVNLIECIHSAVSKSAVPSKIDLTVADMGQNIYVYASSEHITEVFVNIIINAVEAINAKKSDERGKIDIDIIDEDDLVAVNFTDNGCGIPRSNYREIYEPFFSTKTATDCSGIGLDYVKRVVKSHHGDVCIKSKVGTFTLFQIVLPTVAERE